MSDEIFYLRAIFTACIVTNVLLIWTLAALVAIGRKIRYIEDGE